MSHGVCKLTSAGAVDTAFGTNGVTEFSADTSHDEPHNVNESTSGNIYISGYSASATISQVRYYCARLTAGGLIDTTYGTNGVANVQTQVNDCHTSTVLQDDAKAILIGYSYFTLGIARLTDVGTLDPAFGGDGSGFKNYSGIWYYRMFSCLTPDRKLLVGGFYKPFGSGGTSQFVFQRFIADTPPTVNLGFSGSSPTNSATVDLTITFSEPVSGLTVSDITLANVTGASLSGGPRVFTLSISPVVDGQVSAAIPAGVCQDLGGSLNVASSTLSFTSDKTGPNPSVTTTSAAITALAILPFTISFNEPVYGLSLSDIHVTGGTTSALVGSGSIYQFSVTPTGDGAVSADLPAGAVTDTAGNSNAASAVRSVVSDRTAPVCTIAFPAVSTDVRAGATMPVGLTFPESVNGLSSSDVTVSNGAVGALSGSGGSYTIAVTPLPGSGGGTLTVSVVAGATQDIAGNLCPAASAHATVYYSDGTMTPPASVSSGDGGGGGGGGMCGAGSFAAVLAAIAVAGFRRRRDCD